MDCMVTIFIALPLRFAVAVDTIHIVVILPAISGTVIVTVFFPNAFRGGIPEVESPMIDIVVDDTGRLVPSVGFLLPVIVDAALGAAGHCPPAVIQLENGGVLAGGVRGNAAAGIEVAGEFGVIVIRIADPVDFDFVMDSPFRRFEAHGVVVIPFITVG